MKQLCLTPLFFIAFISCTGESASLQAGIAGIQPAAVIPTWGLNPSKLVHAPETDTLKRINGYVGTVFKSHTGDLWFGTHFKGMARFTDSGLTWYSLEQGLAGKLVRDLSEDPEGHLWIATNRGLSKFDGTGFKTYAEADGLPGSEVFCVRVTRDGVVWTSTEKGLFRFNGNQFEAFQLPGVEPKTNISIYPTPRPVNCIFEDRMGNIWFGTNGQGAFCLMKNTQAGDQEPLIQFSESNGLCNNFVQRIFEDRTGNIWFSTRFGGASKLQAYSPLLQSSRFTSFGSAQGIDCPFIWSVYEDAQGALWFTTAGKGVYRLEGNTVTHFTKKDGLSDDYVQGVEADVNGVLWFVTGSGVSRFTGSSSGPAFISLAPFQNGC